MFSNFVSTFISIISFAAQILMLGVVLYALVLILNAAEEKYGQWGALLIFSILCTACTLIVYIF